GVEEELRVLADRGLALVASVRDGVGGRGSAGRRGAGVVGTDVVGRREQGLDDHYVGVGGALLAKPPGLHRREPVKAPKGVLLGIDGNALAVAFLVRVGMLQPVLDAALAGPVGMDAGGDVDVEALLEAGGAREDDREDDEEAPPHTTMTSA